MRLFGLIGYPLTQSFSKKYFTEKFLKESINDAAYELFEIENIGLLNTVLNNNNLSGFNVTIPYKKEVLPFLSYIDSEAAAISACNCIKITDGILKGFNTDAPAFESSLISLLKPHHKKALILGTGGASNAVCFVLKKLGIEYKFVSRTEKPDSYTYEQLNRNIIEDNTLIINTTPLGSFPKVENVPQLPFEYLSPRHYLYDLVYNPPVTLFLQKGQERGAAIKNGFEMLVGQADLSWQIWNTDFY
ncbi:MAG: shikimate dehydrogenase [Sphingobacteriales bacterium]|jgi:shikimate dehydrogenase|nr:shikimate dehydrogenase [Sphingobacteriales bacterium]